MKNVTSNFNDSEIKILKQRWNQFNRKPLRFELADYINSEISSSLNDFAAKIYKSRYADKIEEKLFSIKH